MSSEKAACTQFNQHAWKKEICTNCSKHLSCHKVENSDTVVEVRVKNTPKVDTRVVKSNEQIRQIEDSAKLASSHAGSQNSKPDKPKKPVFAANANAMSKNETQEYANTSVVTRTENEEKLNTNQGKKANQNVAQAKKSNSHYYQIYDVTAKGQSGKPIDLNSNDEESSSDKDFDQTSSCLMATPYTVVDVITNARLAQNTTPPKLPSTPAPDLNRRIQSAGKKDSKSVKKEDPNETAEKQINDNDLENLNSVSPQHYRPRLYEEIDDLFLEKVASKKLEMKVHSEENILNIQITNEEDKTTPNIIDSVTTKTSPKKSSETGHKIQSSRNDKNKKSGGKSFFHKLLGKGNKDDGPSKQKTDKNGRKDSTVDEKSLTPSEDGSKQSSESLLMRDNSKNETETNIDDASESVSVAEVLNRDSCIGEDFAKEIEEKFETLSRKSNLNKSEINLMTTSKFEILNDTTSGEIPQILLASPSEVVTSSDESSMTLPVRKSVLVTSPVSKKGEFVSNRKSMTPAEAKLARKMLVAPPPPPTCASLTSLTSSSCHLSSKDDISSSSARPAPSFFMSLQRRPDPNRVTVAIMHSPTEDVFEVPQIVPRNSLMDDLDEILKKSGMAHGIANTLPKSFVPNQEKNLGKSSMTTGRLPSTNFQEEGKPKTEQQLPDTPVGSSVQQRALPDLPQLPPPTARLHKASLSPESENLYEILPHSEEPMSPKKDDKFSKTTAYEESKLSKSLVNSPTKKSSIGNAVLDSTFNTDSSHLPQNKPRPAPRAAIRTVSTTRPAKKDVVPTLRLPEESYVNSDTNEMLGSLRGVTDSLRMDETSEEKQSLISKLTLQSLQIYLEKFCSPSPLISLPPLSTGHVNWKTLEANIVKNTGSKSSVLSWMRAVFYEILINGQFKCVLMVRKASVMSTSFPKYNHPNLIYTLHSFEATADLPDCQRFFQADLNEKDTKKRNKYIFDVLPYSKISVLTKFPFQLQSPLGNSSTSDSESPSGQKPYDVSKWKAYTLLQILDSLLHLQRLGIELYRIHPSDILLMTPIQNFDSNLPNAPNSDLKTCFFPLLVPTEYVEHSPRSDQKLLCHDLAKITCLVMNADNSLTHMRNKTDVTTSGNTKSDEPHPNKLTPRPRARQTSISLDKNDRCLRKIERVLSSSDSWANVENVCSYLELSLWGPASEEEVRMALASPQRGDLFDWWLSISRAQALVDLVESSSTLKLAPSKPQGPLPKSKVTHEITKTNQGEISLNKAETTKTLSTLAWQTTLETVRKAEFFSRYNVELLLETAKGLFF